MSKLKSVKVERVLTQKSELVIVGVEDEEGGMWRVVLSSLAWNLYGAIQAAPEDAQARIEEWAREYNTSKTAIRRAIGELEQHGFITAFVEEA
jgi:hypothetical protein